MKFFIASGFFFLTIVSVNAQKIENSIYQVLKSQEVLNSNENIELIGENKKSESL